MIYRSPWPAVEIPNAPLTGFVLADAMTRGSRPALVDAVSERTITYAELPAYVERAAAGLSRLGVLKGSVVCILSTNAVDYPVAMLAIARLGAVTTTVNPLCTADDFAKQVVDSGASVLITRTALEPTWRPSAGAFRHVILFDGVALPGSMTFADLATADGVPPAVDIEPDDLVVLPYSSGTTGLPKGVMLTHRNLIANVLQVDATGHAQHDQDVTVAFLPLFHIYGMTVIGLLGLWSGATIVLMPKFDLERYLELVERHRGTLLHVVPPVVVALGKHPSVEGRDYSSIRKLFSGAAPLAKDTIEACTNRIGCVLQQGYGMTEASPATHVTCDEPARNKYGSVGRVVPNTECRVVDPATGRDVEPGADGEIWVRGPQVMRGYLNKARETRDVLDADGWLHTGDIGHADADGDFYVVDRLKELIKYKGMQVPPAELEAVLLTHPAVADAAVVPQADADAGEIPRAFVVLRSPATAEELMAYVAGRVAPYKKVRRVDFIDVIPKSPSGKILRRVLKEIAAT